MSMLRVAIYARVSSEQQAAAGTIASQLAALRERVAQDGCRLPDDMIFVDEGYSGATLVRPDLDRLRDWVAMQGLDRLYVYAPDRLARKYAYQVLLVEEFQGTGVELIFLNRQLGASPEDDLLLQVQGIMAEYERAKILERSRRGKRHAARTGNLNVLSGAPYGYRYVSKQEGGGQARYEIDFAEARVVRQIFAWVGLERASIGEVCRRLHQAGTPTRTGKSVWDRTTVWGMLKNPAYKGAAAFGKTRAEPLRPARSAPATPPARFDGCGASRRMDPPARAGTGGGEFVCGRPRPTPGESPPGPPAAAWCPLSPARAAHLQPMPVRLLWQGHQSQSGQWTRSGLCLLPLYWHRCLSLWR